MWLAPCEYQCVILDGALPGIKELWYRYSSHRDTTVHLYAATPHAPMIEISPFIGRLDPEDPFWTALHSAVASGTLRSNWGCLARTQASPAELAMHFRRWLTIYDDIGMEVFFRFYDPDILPHFVNGLRGDERQWFFGPITAFLHREEGRDLLAVSTADRPPNIELSAALSGMPPAAPWFALEERHKRAMRGVYWPFLVENVLVALLIKAPAYMQRLRPEIMKEKASQCLQWLADLQGVAVPEVEDAVDFCLISFTSCSHFFQSPEFASCAKKHGMRGALDEWKHYAKAPIPGLENWHDEKWLQMHPSVGTHQKGSACCNTPLY